MKSSYRHKLLYTHKYTLSSGMLYDEYTRLLWVDTVGAPHLPFFRSNITLRGPEKHEGDLSLYNLFRVYLD